MGKYIQTSDVISAQSVQMVVACCDDLGTSDTQNPSATVLAVLASIISRAEGLFDSWATSEDLLPLPVPADRLVIEICIEYCVALMFDRRPEYAARFGDATLARSSHYKRAMDLCALVKSAEIEMPDNSLSEVPPNDGGVVYNTGPLMTLPSPSNGNCGGTGDF